jgi:hypothetical protein
MIKKSSIVVLMFMLLWGCGKDKSQPKATIPFQCINSQSSCAVATAFGTVLVTFNVDKVLTELPFSLLVELKKSNLLVKDVNSPNDLKILGYMEGKTMFMGKIPLFFNDKTNDGQFIAETMLGSCSEDLMTWRLWLTLEMTDVNNIKDQTTFFIDFDSTRF